MHGGVQVHVTHFQTHRKDHFPPSKEYVRMLERNSTTVTGDCFIQARAEDMASVKTYLLVPNFTFRPDGPISLGNLIADPFSPHRVLTFSETSEQLPPVETTVEYDYTINRDATRSVSMSIWAQFLETIGGNIGTDYSKLRRTEYTMSALKTSYFRIEPTEDEIRKRVNVPKVRNVMRFGSIRSHPIYMITGIKIAEGFSASAERGTEKGGGFGISAPVADGISIGANVEFSKGDGQRDSFRSGGDIVFAYQLLEIGLKGWRAKTWNIEEFHPKAAFLGDEFEEESDVEVETGAATAEGLYELGRNDVSFKKTEIEEGGEICICISFAED